MRDRTRAAAVANYSLATDFADYLVRKGMPFREAHEAVGKLVRYAEERGVELRRLSLEELRRFAPQFGDDALEIDLTSSLRSRDVPGGTAPAPGGDGAARRERALASTRLARDAEEARTDRR